MVRGETKSLVIALEATGTGVLGYVYFHETSPGRAARTEEIEPRFVLADYDAEGRLLGLEFLHAEQVDGQLMRTLASRLMQPQLAGLDLAEMCKAPA